MIRYTGQVAVIHTRVRCCMSGRCVMSDWWFGGWWARRRQGALLQLQYLGKVHSAAQLPWSGTKYSRRVDGGLRGRERRRAVSGQKAGLVNGGAATLNSLTTLRQATTTAVEQVARAKKRPGCGGRTLSRAAVGTAAPGTADGGNLVMVRMRNGCRIDGFDEMRPVYARWLLKKKAGGRG